VCFIKLLIIFQTLKVREINRILIKHEKLFLNFTSIPLDYLLISWVTNYTQITITIVGFSFVYCIEKFRIKRCHGNFVISHETNTEISCQN